MRKKLLLFLCVQVFLPSFQASASEIAVLGTYGYCGYDEEYGEPTATEYAEACPIITDTARLIGRIFRGIERVRGANFWVCGVHLTAEQAEAEAWGLAYRIVTQAEAAGINPWGLAGTMANESGFDPCAFGKNPRQWAVSEGLLRKRTTTISYPREEVIRVIESEKARSRYAASGFDLGYCQVLSRFYHGDSSDMLTRDTGLAICVREMEARANMHSTKRPWAYWRGVKTEWYDLKIIRWARLLGAKRGEI